MTTIRLNAAEVAELGATHQILHGEFCKPGPRTVDVGHYVFDHTITDPPYSDRAQAMARAKAKRKGQLAKVSSPAFRPLSLAELRMYAAAIARCTRRWAVVFSDAESWNLWADALADCGMEIVRQLIWVRHSSPQFTGDRPAQGHEVMILAHGEHEPIRWNSGGHDNVYGAHGEHPVVRLADGRIHETQKPLSLGLELLADYTDPGESVFDPFAGSGTFNLAAKNMGRLAVGIEANEAHWRKARQRVAAACAEAAS